MVTPTMMPAVAQVAATLSTPVVPSFMAVTKRWETGGALRREQPSTATATTGTEDQRASCTRMSAGLIGHPEQLRNHQRAAATSSGTATHHGTIAVSDAQRARPRSPASVAQNTASTGEKPSSMKTMIEMSEPKWNQ